MDSPAPRRPRRWSPACSGTLARLFVGVMLLAMVSWPERHVPACFLPSGFSDGLRGHTAIGILPGREFRIDRSEFERRGIVIGDRDLLVTRAGSRLLRFYRPTSDEWPSTRKGMVLRSDGTWLEPHWYYRNASLGLLLDIVRGVIDG